MLKEEEKGRVHLNIIFGLPAITWHFVPPKKMAAVDANSYLQKKHSRCNVNFHTCA